MNTDFYMSVTKVKSFIQDPHGLLTLEEMLLNKIERSALRAKRRTEKKLQNNNQNNYSALQGTYLPVDEILKNLKQSYKYYKLKDGEIIKRGDEYMSWCDEWLSIENANPEYIGTSYKSEFWGNVRRKKFINPDKKESKPGQEIWVEIK